MEMIPIMVGKLNYTIKSAVEKTTRSLMSSSSKLLSMGYCVRACLVAVELSKVLTVEESVESDTAAVIEECRDLEILYYFSKKRKLVTYSFRSIILFYLLMLLGMLEV